MPPNRTPYYSNLSNDQKGAWFCSEVKIRLRIKNFIVASPEPDNGDDIWFSKADQQNYIIYPAQVKSAFSIDFLNNGNIRRYHFTISPQRLNRSFKRDYIFFSGTV